jgi:hypothetical protein
MKTPIWFLDIDGVINSVGMPLEGDGVDVGTYRKVDVTTSDDITWPIHYSHVVIDFIDEVHRSGLAEVRWLTTWQQDARLCFAPAVGLDEFFAYDEPKEFEHEWWKESVVRAALAETDTPFIWTDDDLERPIRVGITRALGRECLMIRPSWRPGLSTQHIHAIGRFVAQPKANGTACPIPKSDQSIVDSVRSTRGTTEEDR